MNACEKLSPQLAALASGDALDGSEREQIESHLRQCEMCRAERDALGEVLEWAALPPASDLELHALGALPGQVRAAWQAQERTRRSYSRLALGGLLAAAATLVFAFHAAVPANHRAAVATPQLSQVASDATDSELAVDALPGGPIETADEGDGPFAYDPEVAPTVYTDEGESE